MSNFLAIATVTATLRRMLQAAINADHLSANVTTLRPDIASGVQGWSVNLYLYQVTPNAAWRNSDLPTRRSGGETVQRPQLALNLHYLLTFYGDEVNLEPQRLLGSIVRTLHAMPVLTRKMIGDTLDELEKQSITILADSDLADQIELVRFTPMSLSIEELSKLWSVFFQTPYNLSIAYQGSVVLIESEESIQRALPVQKSKLYVMPFRQPTIKQIVSREEEDSPIMAESTMVIKGKQLRGDVTQVFIGGKEAENESVTDTEIIARLHKDLLAGMQGVRVVHRMSSSPKEHLGMESNVAAFILHPNIKKNNDNKYVIEYKTIPRTNVSPEKTRVNMDINPKVGSKQRVVLLLNEYQPASGNAQAYSSIAEPRTEDTDTVEFLFQGKISGKFLVRVQVDGVESPLEIDEITGQYNNPVVEISP